MNAAKCTANKKPTDHDIMSQPAGRSICFYLLKPRHFVVQQLPLLDA
jgi:hypothetical protein